MKKLTRNKKGCFITFLVFAVVIISLITYRTIKWYELPEGHEVYQQNLQKVAQLKPAVPEIAEFTALFPNFREGLQQNKYPIAEIKPGYRAEWIFSVFLYERYDVSMHINVIYGEDQTEAVFSKCTVTEWTLIDTSLLGDNTYRTREVYTLDLDDWKKLVEAKGDFSVLGLKLITGRQ